MAHLFCCWDMRGARPFTSLARDAWCCSGLVALCPLCLRRSGKSYVQSSSFGSPIFQGIPAFFLGQPPPCQPSWAKIMHPLAAHQDENCSPLPSDFHEEEIHDPFGREGFPSAHLRSRARDASSSARDATAAATASGRPRLGIRASPRHPSTSLASLVLPTSTQGSARALLHRRRLGHRPPSRSSSAVLFLVRRRDLHLYRHRHPSRRLGHLISFVAVVFGSTRVFVDLRANWFLPPVTSWRENLE